MSVVPFQALACPLDGAPLCREGANWRCASGHSFDMARQGYIHLLPVQNKRSRDPGDSKAMVAARQRFLDSGYYQPIAEAVSRIMQSEPSSNDTVRCLDAGCGEGYYLRQLVRFWNGPQILELIGLDISKWAVLSAAKQNKQAAWVVGSNANLPVLPATLDWVLCLFGFPVYEEFSRVLKPGGRVLQVDAGPDHLKELREVIYPSLKSQLPREPIRPNGFIETTTEAVRYAINIDSAATIADLLTMTPHLYRSGPEGRERAAALMHLNVTVDVRLAVLQKI